MSESDSLQVSDQSRSEMTASDDMMLSAQSNSSQFENPNNKSENHQNNKIEKNSFQNRQEQCETEAKNGEGNSMKGEKESGGIGQQNTPKSLMEIKIPETILKKKLTGFANTIEANKRNFQSGRQPQETGFVGEGLQKGPKQIGFGDQTNQQGFGQQNHQGFGQQNHQGFGQQNHQGFGQQNHRGFGQQNHRGFGQQNHRGFGQQNHQGFRQQNHQGFGQQDHQGFGQQHHQGFGQPDHLEFGQQNHQGFEGGPGLRGVRGNLSSNRGTNAPRGQNFGLGSNRGSRFGCPPQNSNFPGPDEPIDSGPIRPFQSPQGFGSRGTQNRGGFNQRNGFGIDGGSFSEQQKSFPSRLQNDERGDEDHQLAKRPKFSATGANTEPFIPRKPGPRKLSGAGVDIEPIPIIQESSPVAFPSRHLL